MTRIPTTQGSISHGCRDADHFGFQRTQTARGFVRLAAMRLLCQALTIAAVLLGLVHPLAALDFSKYVDMLRNAPDFRVRVHAAMALGNTGNTSVLASLQQALFDDHPAVRAAAATALGNIGERGSVPALKEAQRDSSEFVRVQAGRALIAIRRKNPPPWDSIFKARTTTKPPSIPGTEARDTAAKASLERGRRPPSWSRVHHVVTVGEMSNASRVGGQELVELLRSELVRGLDKMKRVTVLGNAGALDAASALAIRRFHIPRLRILGTVMRVERVVRRHETSSRCEVSFLVVDDPGMVMRAVLTGSATRTDQNGSRGRAVQRRLVSEALGDAVRSALRNLDEVFDRLARGHRRKGTDTVPAT